MISKTERFNAGFGIDLIRRDDPLEAISSNKRELAKRKALLSVPIFGLFFGITIIKDERPERPKKGCGAAGLRGILYGSIIGIPVGVALDITAMITQVKALVQAKRAARREQELRPVGF